MTLAQALVQDLKNQKIDHLLLSGDLSNLAFPAEFKLAEHLLSSIGLSPNDITLVPGNHDYYTHQSEVADDFGRIFQPYLRGDVQPGAKNYPMLRWRGEVAVIALNSARASLPLLATGTLGKQQMEQAEQLLSHPMSKQRFRLVMLHHSPCQPFVKWHNRLTDAENFARMLQRTGADLVVHGHLHRFLSNTLPGPDGPIKVIGVGSSTWLSSRDSSRRAQYNLYNIQDRSLSQITVRRFDPLTQSFIPLPSCTGLHYSINSL